MQTPLLSDSIRPESFRRRPPWVDATGIRPYKKIRWWIPLVRITPLSNVTENFLEGTVIRRQRGRTVTESQSQPNPLTVTLLTNLTKYLGADNLVKLTWRRRECVIPVEHIRVPGLPELPR